MRALLASAAVAATLIAPAAANAADKNLAETAASDARFSTLVSLVKQAGLADDLSGSTKLTVFAPTNAAFKKVPKKTLNRLARHPALLKRVLLYHVVAGNVKAAQVVKLKSVKTLAGPKVSVRVRGRNVFLNRTARVTQTDVAASNGTIHVINRVLIPPA